MAVITDLEPIRTDAAWRGDELSTRQDWIYLLSDEQVAELERLGSRFVEEDPDLRFVQKEDLSLIHI